MLDEPGTMALDFFEIAVRPSVANPALNVRLPMYQKGKWCACNNIEVCLYQHESFDAAILFEPELSVPQAIPEHLKYLPYIIIREDELAELSFFQSELAMMDECFFIGYPGTPKRLSATGNAIFHYDNETNFPIARQAIIASMPAQFFKHEHVKTQAAVLTSGVSFSGSSGSPVLTPALGIPPGSEPLAGPYRSAKVIGIMTGHFTKQEIQAEFYHAGLSFFTASIAIRMLIDKARENNWGPPPADFRPHLWTRNTD